MRKVTRRDALTGTAAVVASYTAPASLRSSPDALRKGVQTLVNEIRGPAAKKGVLISIVALQKVADRLEALPGIEPVYNRTWEEVLRPRLESYWRIDRHLATPEQNFGEASS